MNNIEFKTDAGHLYATLMFNEEFKCVQDTWFGSFESQENFKRVLVKLIDLFESKSATKVLTDLNLMIGSFESSREWVAQEVMPKLVQMGLRYQAVILPKNVRLTLSAPALEGFEKRLFTSREEALQWLTSKFGSSTHKNS